MPENFSQIPSLSGLVEERNKILASLIEQYPDSISKQSIENASSVALNGARFRIASYRYEEIKKIDEIVKRIYDENKDDFESEDDVFNLFAKAVMNGGLLEVARLIEKTYGKGSFRKLGLKKAE